MQFFLILIAFILAFSASWAFSYFGLSCFEQLVFHCKVPLEGTNTQFVYDWIKKCFVKAFIISLVIYGVAFFILYEYLNLFTFLILISSIAYGLYRIEFFQFITNQFRKTMLYEKYYAVPKEIKITFEKKRNLILLYAESMETTYTSYENGGNSQTDLIPELSQLAKENISFSHQNQLGGAHVPVGCGWTTGGIVAQSAGVPLTVPAGGRRFSDAVPFLKGVDGLGDILKKEGYEQEFMIGSEALFGGRKFYFDKHGDFQIFDINTAKQKKLIPEDYHVFWGYEDAKLFEFAKEEITRLSKLNKPFHFSMLTVDTHHPYGYKDQDYVERYAHQLSNIIALSSRRIGEFMDWLKEQPFYDNTTVCILGDHTSMAAEYIHDTYDSNYERTIYNAFINAQKKPVKTKNRCFTSFDIFPTILAAMGADIQGNRLGLGVNLFSNEKTLVEEIGLETLNRELKKQSDFYKKHLL